MNENDDSLTHIGIVNRECEKFKLKSITDDQSKSLILICSLQSSNFSIIRMRLMNRLEQEPALTLNDIAAKYQRLVNLQRDASLVQSGHQGDHEVHAVRQTSNFSAPFSGQKTSGSSSAVLHPKISYHTRRNTKKTPPSPCWHCGAWHFVKYCPYRQNKCRDCKTVGHKNGFCKQPPP
ncbi:unnamed protein product [Heterobilharzia americana]|nr:unnamed protein product [Heterobilharzia americana]